MRSGGLEDRPGDGLNRRTSERGGGARGRGTGCDPRLPARRAVRASPDGRRACGSSPRKHGAYRGSRPGKAHRSLRPRGETGGGRGSSEPLSFTSQVGTDCADTPNAIHLRRFSFQREEPGGGGDREPGKAPGYRNNKDTDNNAQRPHSRVAAWGHRKVCVAVATCACALSVCKACGAREAPSVTAQADRGDSHSRPFGPSSS